ncbi:hypothetical protein ACIPJN_32570 [Streptomyces sp. NPDC086796]|uniref:DUF7691 family protein n=1 Tax=unclassified Streptomyces TaxID=2593676 RepID=UPI00341D1A36
MSVTPVGGSVRGDGGGADQRTRMTYRSALQIIIDRNASDPYDLGTYSKPSAFFSLVYEETRRPGVPNDLLPHGNLYGGLPVGSLPCHLVGQVSGHLPLARTKAAADAYRSVLDRVDADFRCDVQELIEKLDFEHEEWQSAMQNIDWHTQDTLFVSLT